MNSSIKHIPLIKSKEFLQAKYVEEGLSIEQIANQTFSSRQTVKKYLRLYNVPLREQDLKKTSLPRFGFKRVQGKIIQCEKEQKVLKMILDLRKGGLKDEKIARVLNSMKIPTKKKNGVWHPFVITTLVKRLSAESI